MKTTIAIPFLNGIECIVGSLTVEIDRSSAAFSVVGTTPHAATELRLRARSAVENSGYKWPRWSVIVTAQPAFAALNTGHDLALALAVLAATGQIPPFNPDMTVVGELGLDGRVRGVRGGVPIGRAGGIIVLCAMDMLLEVQGARRSSAIGVNTLREAVGVLGGDFPFQHSAPLPNPARDGDVDFSDVHGNDAARRALEIAVVGGHGVLLIGNPGQGKTMLARRLPTILPPMTGQERYEAAAIASVAGLARPEDPISARRPFRAPHHSVSDAALIGGGPHGRAGELSLAHNGVLFLDELPEFRRQALESLAAVLGTGEVVIARAGQQTRWPAKAQLIASMNPCPCGYLGHPRQSCNCSAATVAAYQRRVFESPLMRHFDMVVHMSSITAAEMCASPRGETSAVIRGRVETARSEAQSARLPDPEPVDGFHDWLELDVFRRRSANRVARTIAAMDGSDVVDNVHVAEAARLQNTQHFNSQEAT